MDDEIEVTSAQPAPEVETPETENAAVTDAPTPASGEEAPAETTEVPTPAVPEWAKKRFGKFTHDLREAQRQRDALAELVQKLQQNGSEAQSAPVAATPTHAPVSEEQIYARIKFDEACNRTYQIAKGKYGDFDAALGEFQHLGGIPQPFLEQVVTGDDAGDVLYHLSKNLDEAARVFSLPPLQQGREIERLSSKLAKPAAKTVSSAPAPVKPIEGSARASDDLDKLSIEEFMSRRNSQPKRRV